MRLERRIPPFGIFRRASRAIGRGCPPPSKSARFSFPDSRRVPSRPRTGVVFHPRKSARIFPEFHGASPRRRLSAGGVFHHRRFRVSAEKEWAVKPVLLWAVILWDARRRADLATTRKLCMGHTRRQRRPLASYLVLLRWVCRAAECPPARCALTDTLSPLPAPLARQ